MVNKEIKIVVDAVSNEKDIDQEIVYEALEEAMAAAALKSLGDYEASVKVHIDRKTGEIHAFREYEILSGDDESFSETLHKTPESLEEQGYEAMEIGEKFSLPLETPDLGRISAQTAKNVVYQRLKQARAEKLVQYYEDQIGQMVTGVVKKATREMVLVDLPNGAEGVLPRREMIPRETFRLNDRVKAVVQSIQWEKKTPNILLSRIDPAMLTQLFSVEVPEIGQGTIEIRAVARDPGSRAKIAVQAKDARIEPKGACIGMRGARVNSVMEQIEGERIDVILWDENDAQFVMNALSPAQVLSIVVDEQEKSMQVVVDQETLSQAIGRNGQNVRLAAELTGWKVNVLSQEQAEEVETEEAEKTIVLFRDCIGLADELAQGLIEAGFTEAQELAYVDDSEYLELGLDQESIDYIRQKAKSFLERTVLDYNNLETIPLMHEKWSKALLSKGLKTWDDIAEFSVDELRGIIDISEKEAGELIMAARAPWFD
jgi:N utilization substance protein A